MLRSKIELVLFSLVVIIGCNAQKHNQRMANHLIEETSPYLLQHAYNPVDWHPWNDQALDKAAQEDKLMIISIGYSACHWCHVMERESFEDTAVAHIMNKHFVNIKVDREERPDVDNVYMAACQLTSGGSCGWPLNSITLPDGRPVWAGTYFPKKQWVDILNYFIKAKENEYDKLVQYADQVQQGMIDTEIIPTVNEDFDIVEEDINQWEAQFIDKVDWTYGGMKGAPKFPMPNNFLALLKLYDQSGNQKLLDATTLTLDQMAMGGIHDQLLGGFARYSVDELWKVPHFEKMLYDNAQLLSLYAEAFRLTQKDTYRDVIQKIVTWLETELLDSKTKAFFSSIDADSEGEEGKYYVWSTDELSQLLEDEEFQIVQALYEIKEKGNWEDGKNILHSTGTIASMAEENQWSLQEATEHLKSAHDKLLKSRSERVSPGIDDKILTSWNALLVKGLVDAYMATSDTRFLKYATETFHFIDTELSDGDQLLRTYKNGKAHISGFLDDYAHYIQACLSLYQVTFDESYLSKANKRFEYMGQHFSDEETGLFFYTSDLDNPLVVRKKETVDNEIPSSNSILAEQLYLLGHLQDNQEYIDIAKTMYAQMSSEVQESIHPDFYSNWIEGFHNLYSPDYEIAIVGPEAGNLRDQLMQKPLINAVFLGGKSEGSLPLLEHKLIEGQTTIYVCQNKVCKLPVTEVEEALKLMDQSFGLK